MIHKIKKFAYAAAAAALTVPALTSAQWSITDSVPDNTNLTNNGFLVILQRVLNWLLGILAVMAVIGFVVSGIMYLTAAGDEDRVGTAKRMLTYSIIGVVVALIGLIIVTTLDQIISGQ